MATSPNSPHLCWSASEDGYVRRLDSREPHTCATTGSATGNCRNIIIDLRLNSKSSLSQPTQCKCIDINPVRTEQIAVGALDAYARIYDARLCSLRSSERSSLNRTGDPSCIAFLAPGHLSSPSMCRAKKSPCSTVAATYLTFSADGEDLLVNLSGEQVYLYNVANYQQPIAYDFEKSDSGAVPEPRPILRTCRTRGVGTGSKLLPFASDLHSVLTGGVDEAEVKGEVADLKNRGKQLYKEEKLHEALLMLNSAISKCSNWHLLYFLRGTTLYSRKWSVERGL